MFLTRLGYILYQRITCVTWSIVYSAIIPQLHLHHVYM